jgi:hypothetical protein
VKLTKACARVPPGLAKALMALAKSIWLVVNFESKFWTSSLTVILSYLECDKDIELESTEATSKKVKNEKVKLTILISGDAMRYERAELLLYMLVTVWLLYLSRCRDLRHARLGDRMANTMRLSINPMGQSRRRRRC